jgi:hypothetical protein
MTGERDRRAGFTDACVAFDADLESYLEGEDLPQVRLHARECAYCGCMLADLEEIRQASGEEMVREAFEAEPSAALWSSLRTSLIEEGIIRAPQGFLRRWLETPASLVWRPIPVAALAATAVLGFFLLNGRNHFFNSGSGVRSAQTFQQASVLGMSLASLDDEIVECRKNAFRQPSNPLTAQYLASAYAQKAEVLQSALETNAP